VPGLSAGFFGQHNTMESLLERGEKLDDLVSKSEVLGAQSKAFYKTVSAGSACHPPAVPADPGVGWGRAGGVGARPGSPSAGLEGAGLPKPRLRSSAARLVDGDADPGGSGSRYGGRGEPRGLGSRREDGRAAEPAVPAPFPSLPRPESRIPAAKSCDAFAPLRARTRGCAAPAGVLCPRRRGLT